MNITSEIRKRIQINLSLDDLLPDHMPAFVRSPIYFFGVLCLSSFVFLIITGIILAACGPTWWHNNTIGHFINSLHFWSAETFFFSMTLHLWGSFFKGAWRHGRGLTWISGMLLFLTGIGTAFTGYLSMTNFSAQWIATQGKDALNSVGIGAFFNLLDFGQIYGFHIIILPLLLLFLVTMHLLLVRIRGIVRPYAPTLKEEQLRADQWKNRWFNRTAQSQEEKASAHERQIRYYRGLHMMPYDLIREGIIALLAIFVLIVTLAGCLSSPDEPPITIQQYAQQNPIGFINTAMQELSSTSTIAQYGPPYNQGTGSLQFIGPISLQQAAGVTHPINNAHIYVLDPLATSARTNPQIAGDLKTFTQASTQQQATWENDYITALGTAKDVRNQVQITKGIYGPLPGMMNHLLTLATGGTLDGLLLRSGRLYQTDFTAPLLFLSEDALTTKATQFHLLGSEWGIMNETGSYPGQTWLWLYTLWYQIPPYNTSSNADALALLTTGLLTGVLILFPFIPYINRLPYYLGIHRLIWREYYTDVQEIKRKGS